MRVEKPIKSRNPFLQLIDEVFVYKVHIIVATVVTAVLGGSIYFYNSYRTSIETQAHSDFVASLEYYNAKVSDGKKDENQLEDTDSFDTYEEKWNKVAAAFSDGYSKNQNSKLAPLFLAFESEAYVNLAQLDKAIAVLGKALGLKMPAELQQAYLVKLALMKIDLKDKTGLELLTAFADEYGFAEGVKKVGFIVDGNKNFMHDYTLYRLGEYYWLHKDFNQTRNYWNQLTLKYGKGTQDQSLWAIKASDKLKLIEGK